MSKELLHRKFEHIFNVINNPSFLAMDSLGGEIPFWISTYYAEQENEVRTGIGNLSKKLSNHGIQPHLIDLFELSIKILDSYVGLDSIYTIEQRKPKPRFKKALQSSINIHERFIPAIKSEVEAEEPDLLLISGVGSVFPFIRSHTVLNNLQSAVKNIPTIMFFPGKYTGQSLNLFGKLKDDNYYRAFNIDNYKL